jgi:3-hydroxybutyryl-CoA dehydrogenase
LNVTNYFYQELNKEVKWSAPRMMKDLVKAGRVGRKVGKGWYDYNK